MSTRLLIFALLSATASFAGARTYLWTEIDTTSYQRYLLATSIRSDNRSDKFIVDVLWTGLRRLTELSAKFGGYAPNSTHCLSAMNRYFHGVVDRDPHLWALKMYDSSSSNGPGFITGNVQEMGSYDECVTTRYGGFNAFQGKFCTVYINDTAEPLVPVKTLTMVPVTYSLCVPSVCTAKDIAEMLDIGSGVMFLRYPYTISERTCFTNEKRPMQTSDWVAIFVFLALALACIAATCYETMTRSSSKSRLRKAIVSFSLWSNGNKLMSVDRGHDAIGSLYGLRFLLMVWIVIIHRFSMMHAQPAMGLFQWDSMLRHWSRAIIVNGFICVDTFFVMTGMLISYTFLKRVDDEQMKFNVYKYYLHRYIRLTPALAGLVLMYATFSDLLCDGPSCTSYFDSIKKSCVTNWWATLLYVNNYYDNHNMCTIQGWYMSIDMQLVILSPVLLFLLLHRPDYFHYVFGPLLAVAAAASVIQPYLNRIAAGYYVVGKLEDHRIFLENYVYTHTRASSWLMGFALGIYMRDYLFRPRRIAKHTLILFWALTVGAFASVIFGILPFQQESHEYNPFWDTLYKSAHRHIWALASCWLIFACSTGHGGILNRFLSWDRFQPLGRLAYCVNLSHIIIQKWQLAAARTPINFTDMTKITLACGDTVASVFGAAVLYLMFEAPARELEKLIMGQDLYMEPKRRSPVDFEKERATENAAKTS